MRWGRRHLELWLNQTVILSGVRRSEAEPNGVEGSPANAAISSVPLLLAVTYFFLTPSRLTAQPITIQLTNLKAALLQIDSTNWNEAWVELSGNYSPSSERGEGASSTMRGVVNPDNLTVTSGNRVAEILSVDSVGWKFRSMLALSFVLDNSGSMFHAFDSLTKKCDSIINSLPVGVIGQAITFDKRYRGASHLYTSRASTFIAQREFTDSLTGLSYFWHFYDTIRTQYTPLYDAIAAAITNIGHRREREKSEHSDVVIVVTDGEDNASRTAIELLEKLLASAHLRLFAINFRTEEDNRLEWLARKTGGEYFSAATIGELGTLLHSMGLSLTGQYHIRYRFPTLGPSSGR